MGNTYDPKTGFTDRVVSKLPDEKVIINSVSGATYTTLEDYIDTTSSTGLITGGVVTDGGSGTVDITGGTAYIRDTDSDIATIYSVDFTGVTGQALTDGSLNYIYVEWNGGSPQITVSTAQLNNNTNALMAIVHRGGTEVHITNVNTKPQQVALCIGRRFSFVNGVTRQSGSVTSETGTRNIAITEGIWWLGLVDYALSSVDTSVSDTFSYYFQDGAGGWVETAGQTQINNTRYDDGTGADGVDPTLPAGLLTGNRYGVHWVYKGLDGDTAVIYGRGNYTLNQAINSTIPENLPGHMTGFHVALVARIIIQNGDSTFTDIATPYEATFTQGVSTAHSDLSGLTNDDHIQYLLVDGTRAMTGNLDMSSNNITNIFDATVFNNLTVLGGIGNSNGTQLFSHTGAGLRATGVSKFSALGTFGNAEGVRIFKDSGATFLSSEEFFQIKDGELGNNLLGVSEDATKVYNNLDALAGVDVTGDITVTGTVDGIDIATDVAANTAKVTNATHTGEVTGSGALTVHPTAISNKMVKVTPVATDMLLLWDATDSALKKVDASNFLGSGGVTDHGALTGLADDDHTQYLPVNGTRAMTGDLDMGTSEIKLDETKKIIFDSNATSTQYINADTFFGFDIFKFRSGAVFNFDITSNVGNGRYDFQLGTDTDTQYFRIRNDSGTTLFQIYGDGEKTKGMILSYNGGGTNVGAGGSKKDIFFGVNTANGGLPIPANGTLQRLGISTNSVTTSGKLRLYYSLNGGSWTATAAELNTTDTWTSIDDTLSVSLTKGDRLQFQYWSDPDSDGNAYAPTSAEPTITVYITTNE